MSSVKLATGFVAAALTLSACGSSGKPVAGATNVSVHQAGARGVVDDARMKHLQCLEGLHVPVVKRGKTDLLIGTPPNQVAATFAPTPGAAQTEQFSGHVQGAEVIGPALLYPGTASDSSLKPIEDCLAQGVTG
jgi:hypothetical protein